MKTIIWYVGLPLRVPLAGLILVMGWLMMPLEMPRVVEVAKGIIKGEQS